jgi:putative ABC transport system permease protein
MLRRGWRWLDALRGDARFALRHFRRTPLSTVTMIVVLALGIGVNVVLYGVFRALTTVPGPGIERDAALVRIRGTAFVPSANRLEARAMSYPEAVAYSERRELFAGTGISIDVIGRLSLVGSERVSNGALAFVSDHYFELLRVRPQLGSAPATTSLDASDATALSAVIGHKLWQDVFDSAPGVVGRTLRINDVAVTIVGVMPPRFRGASDGGPAHRVWLPLAAYPLVEQSGAYAFISPDSALFHVIARLQPGLSHRDAEPVVKAIAARASAAMTRRPDRSIASADIVRLLPYNLDPRNDREVRLVVTGVSVLTLLILLVTCTNVSSLLVGMALARRREIAVRLSLGAARGRLIAQMLTESALIAFAAAGLASVIIWSFVRYLDARFPDDGIGEALVFDWRVALFTGGIALLTTLLFGLSPALHATRLALADVLKDAGAAVSGSRSRLHRVLVVTQITLTQPLLVALGFTALIGYYEVRNLRPAANEDRIVQMYFAVHDWSRRDVIATEMERVRERLAAVPGVVAAARESYPSGRLLTVHPMDRTGASQLPDTIFVEANFITPDYLHVHDLPVRRGRHFVEAERDSAAAAVIIDDKLARALFGSTDPIGRRLLLSGDPAAKPIVGIIDEELVRSLRGSLSDRTPLIFVSTQRTEVTNWMLVRTAGPGNDMLATLRAAATSDAPQFALTSVRTAETARLNNRRELLEMGGLLAVGAFVTLLLAAIGLYAVVAFAVNQRTREIGIRTALGARQIQVMALFFRSGLSLSAIGLAIGLPLSLLPLFLLSGLGVRSSWTLWVLGLVAGCVLCVASVATWIPARRAAAVDPLTALRSE